jgi:DNA-binding NarL/FixJ family response regulator
MNDTATGIMASAATGVRRGRRKWSVLVADDHALVRIGIGAVLAASDRFVLCGEAIDGIDCLEKVASLRPDLLLLDILMPRLSGLEAIPKVRDASPATRILFLSAQESRAVVLQALGAGADGYLTKDALMGELRDAMDAACDGRRYVSPRIAGLAAAPADGSRAMVLTERQTEVLRGIASGLSNKRIARELGVSPKTVEFHRAQLMNRLDLHDVASLTRYALEGGLVD